jgi:hypothetical protein
MQTGAETDQALLEAFQPVVRFTRGEYFYPVSVGRYVRAATLWSEFEEGDPVALAAPGTLSLDTLADRSATTQGLDESLSGIVAPGKPGRVKTPAKQRPPKLKGGSRLAVVGLLARLIDALNRVSLLFRGSVPGGSAARSYALQREHLAPDEPTCYGRVVREGGWIICQYWFFYAFNNWRSAFGGVNEHEADWEQVTIYLDGSGAVDEEGLPAARWVVFSAHDETGDDLRRRWDDPDLSVVDARHPVVFAGAGSHSGAYLAGDYLITIPTPTLGGLVKAMRWVGRVLAPWSKSVETGIGIPYVDYARGDGRSIGPGGDPWTIVRIDDDTGWVRDYRGLWGHDTGDRLGGERGPAGPRYERDGTVRQSWADPIGWAGLAKVAPSPAVEAQLIASRIAHVDVRLSELEAEVSGARLALATSAAGLAPAAPEVRALADEEERVLGLRMEKARLRDERARMQAKLGTPPQPADPHAHLRHRRTPLIPVRGVRNKIRSWWSVLSTPVILFAVGAVILPGPEQSATVTAIVWLVLLLSIEGFVRGQFLAVLARMVGVVVVLIGLYYLVVDWRILLGWGFVAAAALLFVANIRDAVKR